MLYLNWHEHTVKNTLRRLPQKGLGRLWETPGRGPKRGWSEEDGQAVEQWVEEPCRYSVRQISQKLLEDRFVEIGAEQVRRWLKKKGWVWKRVRYSRALNKLPEWTIAKRRDWEMLQLWAQQAVIRLKYID
ncbi:helix-turn-helix domain-containing protein [Microcoleus sp. SVA1_B6]|uniref:helix-turn-helix domain-containing protein n=1 Tax=Microcoleus sp. SVA1_B6 TaxID=2818952 RepID=UPI002FD6ECD0